MSTEFDKKQFKTKSNRLVMSDDVLAYTLLKPSNLSNYHYELIKATIDDLQHNLIKDQLQKTFSDGICFKADTNEDRGHHQDRRNISSSESTIPFHSE